MVCNLWSGKSILCGERKRVCFSVGRERKGFFVCFRTFGGLSPFVGGGVWCLELVVLDFDTEELGEFVLADGLVVEVDLALDCPQEPLEAEGEDSVEDFLLGHAFEAGVSGLRHLLVLRCLK